MTKPELLAPAGDLEKLKVAIAYGADAVYMGGRALGMRANAKNFSPQEMAEGITYAHAHGKKVYITANIFAHNADFEGMADYFTSLQEMGADALIVSDLGVFSLARSVMPNMELHLSTQANCTNYAAAAFWRNAGAARVILARELSMAEIREINRQVPDLHIECFVHGAMCMAYSGRCLISNYIGNTKHADAPIRDANGGDCIQPCRWEYDLKLSADLIEKKSGEVLPLHEDESGTYIMNARDMCMIRHIPDLVDVGIRSFKIEGRMKTAYYVAATVAAYRQAIDDYYNDPQLYMTKRDDYAAALARLGSGRYSTGFYFGKPSADDHSYTGDNRFSLQDFLAIVESYDPATELATVEQCNKFVIGDPIQIFRANAQHHTQTIEAMYDEHNKPITSAPHPKQKVQIKLNTPVTQYDIIRRA
ncbi:MAG: U32 family peptidase [Defluviitaleaceae bacterium]|nr:U32 family peptidase [Defluviitaleaceae bacterium]